jgi:DNA-binding PadR family transcriptional regulator
VAHDDALPLKPVDYLVLLALNERDRHGYGIVKDIERLSDGQVRLVPGNLYPVIARLVDAGTVREAAARDGDARRRHYRLTAAGRRLLAAETRRLEELLARPETARVLRGTGRS